MGNINFALTVELGGGGVKAHLMRSSCFWTRSLSESLFWNVTLWSYHRLVIMWRHLCRLKKLFVNCLWKSIPPVWIIIVIHFLQVMDKAVNNIWKMVTISHSDVIGSFAKNLHKKPFQLFVGSSDFSPKEYVRKNQCYRQSCDLLP